MIVAISGASGLIGSALSRHLESRGDRVLRLVRSRPSADGEIAWDPARGTIDAARLERVDAVVNLAGETIGAWPWSAARKARIRESRLQATGLLARTLAGLARRPRVLVSASAVGYYGNRGSMPLDETCPAGTGFLADLCVAWEAATEPAARAGIRVVTSRTGMVLSGAGGALAPLLLPFRLGVGGPIGSGRQYMSWIAIDDLTCAIAHMISAEALAGAVNAVSPHAVTNAEFTRALGRAVKRPAILPVPAPAARLLLGEMADELLLSSARALPGRLLATGFEFRYPEIDSALGAALG